MPHRDAFLSLEPASESSRGAEPTLTATLISLGILIVTLLSVIGSAKTLTPSIEAGVAAASAPSAVVGIAIALLILSPETVAAARSGANNQLQTNLNLALGSGLAGIGLIPVVAAAASMAEFPWRSGCPRKKPACWR